MQHWNEDKCTNVVFGDVVITQNCESKYLGVFEEVLHKYKCTHVEKEDKCNTTFEILVSCIKLIYEEVLC